MARLSEKDTLEAAVARLRALPGIRISELERDHAFASGKTAQIQDRVLQLETDSGTQQYIVETKHLTSRTLPTATQQLRQYARRTGKRPLLATDYVSEPLIDALLAQDMEFVDTAGNTYLKSPAYYALVRGKSREQKAPVDVFSATGLKVIYALLAFPHLRKATYREIRDVAEVGLGSVGRTIHTLLELGHLIKGHSNILHVANYRELLERWELGYLETLRPRLAPTEWRFTSTGRQEILDELPEKALVGGEEAATILTGRLKPQTLTLHLPERQQKDLRIQRRLFPATEQPDVILLPPLTAHDRYIPAKDSAGVPLAQPILVRAELLALAEGRLREVADALLEDVILPGEVHA